MISDHVVLLVTAPTRKDAERLARGLVEARLAACVNVLPQARSFYRWEGKICEDDELQLFIKTVRGRADAVRDYVLANHPYETPEVVVLGIEGGSEKYLRWIDEETR